MASTDDYAVRFNIRPIYLMISTHNIICLVSSYISLGKLVSLLLECHCLTFLSLSVTSEREYIFAKTKTKRTVVDAD